MKKLFGCFAVAALLATMAPSQATAQCPEDPEATIAAACPCESSNGNGNWKNHGAYQSCVVRLRNDLRRQGCLDSSTQRTIARCAARSTCGKEGAVLCCEVTGTGSCDGAIDGVAGTCSNDETLSCSSDADCTTLSSAKVKRSAEVCTDRGGYVSGSGSVCGGCAAPVACCLATGCEVLTATDCADQGGTSTAGAAPSCDPNPCQ